MDDLRELYQELILDHNASPHNYGPMQNATHQAEGYNPLCGDHVMIYLKISSAGVIEALQFSGQGCAMCKSSASLMTDLLKGKNTAQAESIFSNFHAWVAGNKEVNTAALGKLVVFAGVREFPMRVKCVTLAWHAMQAALTQWRPTVSTE